MFIDAIARLADFESRTRASSLVRRAAVRELRADSGFAIPALHTWCEQEGMSYTIRLMINDRLEAIAASLLAEATQLQQETGQWARLAGEIQYGAGSWESERLIEALQETQQHLQEAQSPPHEESGLIPSTYP
jgi:hypothetical protein